MLLVFAPGSSALATAARARSLTVVAEVFADRGYMKDGSLVPRNRTDLPVRELVRHLAHPLLLGGEREIDQVTVSFRGTGSRTSAPLDTR